MSKYKILLVDVNESLVQSWKREFKEYSEFVEVKFGSIFDTPCSAMVSPANSFGFMDGGLDFHISRYFGTQLATGVRQKITDDFDGELLVGQALVIGTGRKEFPYLISAPTMRVSLNIANTPNVYLASKAIFTTINKFNGAVSKLGESEQIKSVAIPGLGTGVGGVTPDSCAAQMKQAFEDFYLGGYQYPKSFGEAIARHRKITSPQDGQTERGLEELFTR